MMDAKAVLEFQETEAKEAARRHGQQMSLSRWALLVATITLLIAAAGTVASIIAIYR